MSYKVVEFTVTALYNEDENEGSGIHDVLTDAVVNEASWVDGILHITWSAPTEREYIKDEFTKDGWPDEALFGDSEEEEN